MTYCVGMLVDAGLVFLSDSRTNAGIDQISTFRKTAVFGRDGERVLVLMSAGNLAITQAAQSMLREAVAASDSRVSLATVPNLFEAARHVGETLREIHRRDADALQAFGVEFNAALILGGQIRGEPPRLFNIYAAGNFIEATPETSYFQIGESKYGKPIIDRVLQRTTSLEEAAKCALISMDSTLRSNLSVGLPLDLTVVHAGTYKLGEQRHIDGTDSYFAMIQSRWGSALRATFDELPDPSPLGKG